jgi:hypothetical protein
MGTAIAALIGLAKYPFVIAHIGRGQKTAQTLEAVTKNL